MEFEISRADYDSWGGTLEPRVAAFRSALEQHVQTVDVPAPVEGPLVEYLARNPDVTLKIIEQPVEAPPPTDPLRTIPPLEFRRRFTFAERCALTMAASVAMAGGNPALQVVLDDLNSAQEVFLDDPEVRQGLMLFVEAGILSEQRVNEVLR